MPYETYPAVAAAPKDPYRLLPGSERFVLADLEQARLLLAQLSEVGRPCVYTYRNEDGLPLYVGQTGCLTSRMHGHRRESWFGVSTFLDVIPATMGDKRPLERELIASLRPVHNIAP